MNEPMRFPISAAQISRKSTSFCSSLQDNERTEVSSSQPPMWSKSTPPNLSGSHPPRGRPSPLLYCPEQHCSLGHTDLLRIRFSIPLNKLHISLHMSTALFQTGNQPTNSQVAALNEYRDLEFHAHNVILEGDMIIHLPKCILMNSTGVLNFDNQISTLPPFLFSSL